MSKKYTVVQLRTICKEKGITGYSKLKKDELLKKCLHEKVKNKKKRTLKSKIPLANISSPPTSIQKDTPKKKSKKKTNKVVSKKYLTDLKKLMKRNNK